MTLTADTFGHATDTTDRACPCGHGTGHPVWCLRCATTIHTDLQRIPTLAAQAFARRDGQLLTTSPRGEVRATSPDPASPSPAHDALDAVLRWASYWASTLAARIGRWDHGRGGLVGDVAYLTRHTSALLVGPDALDAGTAVMQMARNLERGAGQDAARHPLGAPCPSCDRLSLFRWDGTDRVECGAPDCDLVTTWVEYEAGVVARAAAVRRRRGSA